MPKILIVDDVIDNVKLLSPPEIMAIAQLKIHPALRQSGASQLLPASMRINCLKLETTQDQEPMILSRKNLTKTRKSGSEWDWEMPEAMKRSREEKASMTQVQVPITRLCWLTLLSILWEIGLRIKKGERKHRLDRAQIQRATRLAIRMNGWATCINHLKRGCFHAGRWRRKTNRRHHPGNRRKLQPGALSQW